MSDINTGGPAFPIPLLPGQGWQGMAPCDGMTLRDYFAAKAMQPLMAHSGGYWNQESLAVYAEIAYKMADAMLKAREQ